MNGQYSQRYKQEKQFQIDKLKQSPLLQPLTLGDKNVLDITERQQMDFKANVGKLQPQPPLLQLDDSIHSSDAHTTVDITKETSELQNIFE